MQMQEQIEEMIAKIQDAEAEIGKAIIGQKEVIRQVMLAVLIDGNVLLEGVPGLGKTQLVKAVSKVLDLEFSRIQFTPDLMPADVTGTNLVLTKEGKNTFVFETGPVFANLVLADEINRATPKTQSALLEAMQEKTVTVGKQTYTLPEPYMVLATQNPIENEGTYPLPEAQLDRFAFKLYVEFPSLDELSRIMDVTITNESPVLEKKISGEEILSMRSLVKDIPMAGPVREFALKIVLATHPETNYASDMAKRYVTCGASPRAAQAIILASKARALMQGRLNVAFEDVEFVAYPALRHRLVLNFDAVADAIAADTVIADILETIKQE